MFSKIKYCSQTFLILAFLIIANQFFMQVAQADDFLPESSNKYTAKKVNEVAYYSGSKCPSGELIGTARISHDSYYGNCNANVSLNRALRIGAMVGGDYICYRVAGSWESSLDPCLEAKVYRASDTQKVISVDSSPTGVPVKMSGQLLGRTPFKFTADRSYISLEAIPNGAGQCVQEESIDVDKAYRNSDDIKVYFNMYLCRHNTLDVNIN